VNPKGAFLFVLSQQSLGGFATGIEEAEYIARNKIVWETILSSTI
jgi:hypothetical protein